MSAGEGTPERHNPILLALNSEWLLSLENLRVTRFRGKHRICQVSALMCKLPDMDMSYTQSPRSSRCRWELLGRGGSYLI